MKTSAEQFFETMDELGIACRPACLEPLPDAANENFLASSLEVRPPICLSDLNGASLRKEGIRFAGDTAPSA
jgi:hypothetical protein